MSPLPAGSAAPRAPIPAGCRSPQGTRESRSARGASSLSRAARAGTAAVLPPLPSRWCRSPASGPAPPLVPPCPCPLRLSSRPVPARSASRPALSLPVPVPPAERGTVAPRPGAQGRARRGCLRSSAGFRKGTGKGAASGLGPEGGDSPRASPVVLVFCRCGIVCPKAALSEQETGFLQHLTEDRALREYSNPSPDTVLSTQSSSNSGQDGDRMNIQRKRKKQKKPSSGQEKQYITTAHHTNFVNSTDLM
ncbi:translation initiation factor IF-2-like [Pyrgilauda ruficollis]|uniref:translation initiation factor IF-2-like n=1 Tax=Pyrgilauda ruficollis TaxID=221976 RepID=UPI001B87E4F8|nr:translation initiation factor IF-2-like [Pyrgilauda ruficollis]